VMSVSDDKTHQIGTLAAEFGLNPKTLRYYETIGLLRAPQRTASGYRMYGQSEREQLAFIMKARVIGLTLQEIGEILALRRGGDQPCEHVVGLLDTRLVEIESQIQALQEFRDDLTRMRSEAAETASTSDCICGIIERHQSQYAGLLPLPLTQRRRVSGHN
jgi:DNA-binding transcriptional MerR regulator